VWRRKVKKADGDGLVQSLDFEDDVELNKMVDDGDLT
jgi:hypothetical protein